MLSLNYAKRGLLRKISVIFGVRFLQSTVGRGDQMGQPIVIDIPQQLRRCRQLRSVSKYLSLLKTNASSDLHCQMHMQLAQLYSQTNQNQKAINHYSSAIKLSPTNSQLYVKLGECLRNEGEIFQAIALLQKGIRSVQNQEELYLILGDVFFDLEDYSQALENYFLGNNLMKKRLQKQEDKQNILTFDLKERIRAYSKNLQDQLLAEKIKEKLLNQGKLQQSMQFFETSKRLLKRNCFTALFMIGSINFQMGNLLEGEKFLLEALQLNKNHYETNLYLATIYLHQNCNQKALLYFDYAFSIDNSKSLPLSSKGLIFMKNRQNVKAMQYFEQALKIDETDTIALSSLGILMLAKGEVEKGIKLLKRTIQLDPSNVTAIQKLKTTWLILGKEQQLRDFDIWLEKLNKK